MTTPGPTAAPKLRRVMVSLALLGVALAGFFLAAAPWRMPSTGLDPSWWAALEYAYLHGLVLGRDFSFTSGPLSFAYTRFFHPDTFIWVAIAVVHAAAVYVAAVYWSPHRRASAVLLGGLALCWAPLSPDALYLSLPLAVFLLSITSAAPAFVVAILVAGLALTSLAKFSVVLLSLPLLVLADGLALIERRPRYWHAALYCASLVALYCAAGQPLNAMPDFLVGSIDIAFGYGQAMANFDWTSQQTALVLVSAGLLASAILLLPRAVSFRSVFCIVGLSGYILIAFKLGNVRAGHQWITWYALAVASFLLILLPVARPRRAALVAGAWILICAGVSQLLTAGFQPRAMVSERAERVAAFVAGAAAWLGPGANFERLAQQRRAADEQLASRAPRDLVGTVGSLPWEFSELIAAGARFAPSPALQAYSNYSPRLRRLTAQHFASDARPENLFFELLALDGRFRTTELGPALIPILAGYDVVRARSRLLGAPIHLRRRAQPRAVELRPIESRSVRLDDWVDAPRLPDRALMLALRLHENPAGKIATLLYKQEPSWIDLRFANGTEVSARAFPNLVSDGFLILPPEMTAGQLFAAAEDGFALGKANPLVAFRMRPTRLGAFRFSADYEFEASAVRIAGQAEHPIAPEAPAATAMQALIEGRVIESPEIRVIQDRLLAHAPSKIVAAMPKGRRLTGEIGYFDGAWREGSPGAVTFAISRVTPTGARLLFEKTLDPKSNPADRGPQTFSIDLGPDGSSGEPTELLFETRPGTSWGWTYWSQLQLGE
jgi:hypothetical protein